jgi:pimeloyl-ACP methyl ester carboxylesterase
LFNAVPLGKHEDAFKQLSAEAGRIAFQLGFGAFNLARSNRVDKSSIACPMLALAEGVDHIVPIGVSRSMVKWYGHQVVFYEYPQHGHWMPGEPLWQTRADEVLPWMDALKAQSPDEIRGNIR